MTAPRVLLRTALLETSGLRPHVMKGLDALKDADVTLIHEPERPRVGDSLDLDTATAAELPDAHRWDYLLSVPGRSRIVALEPHSAKDSEISVVIAKKRSAVAYLRDHLPPKHRVASWFWVTHGKVSFSKMEKARRRLDQAGISFEGRTLRSL